jgi:hypothetical protein
MGFVKSILFGLVASFGILAVMSSFHRPTPLISSKPKVPSGTPLDRRIANKPKLEKSADKSKTKKFSPNDRFQVMDYARTLIKELGPKFGIYELPKTDEFQIRTGEFSAQVVAKQTFRGVPVFPGGTLTLDLGPSGEVIEFNSSYYQDLEATNSPDKNEKEIQKQVLEFSKATFGPSKLEGGSLLFRVEGDKKGRFVREYSYAGQKIIVDAQDGSPIRVKDSRIH